MRGIFDDTYTELPVACVCLRSPRFRAGKDIFTEAAVGLTAFSDNTDCIIGNKFFREHSDLRDIINLDVPLTLQSVTTADTMITRRSSNAPREPVDQTAQPTSLMHACNRNG